MAGANHTSAVRRVVRQVEVDAICVAPGIVCPDLSVDPCVLYGVALCGGIPVGEILKGRHVGDDYFHTHTDGRFVLHPGDMDL
jgi:hypothetical protein